MEGGIGRTFAAGVDEVLAFDFDKGLNPISAGFCKKCDAPNARLEPVERGEWSVFDADSTRTALALMRALYFDDASNPTSARGALPAEGGAGPFDRSCWDIRLQAGQRALVGDRGDDPRVGKFELVMRPSSCVGEEGALVLRGDTLVTYRAMVAAALGRRSPDDLDPYERAALEGILDDGGAPILDFCVRHGRLANDHRLSSLFLLPYRRDFALNGPRGIGAAYKDNPFAFFEVLRQAYLCDGDAERVRWAGEDDAVRRGIRGTWVFWGLFGAGEGGYRAFLDRFCLTPALDAAYDEFRAPDVLAGVRTAPREERLAFLARYVRALHGLGRRRAELIRPRLIALGAGERGCVTWRRATG